MIVLALSVVCLVLLGYVLMGRLDRFLESGGFDAPRGCVKGVLVFVDAQRRLEVEDALQPYRTYLRYTGEPVPPEGLNCTVVFAASGRDADNILLCAQACKSYPARMIALCNQAQYRFIYRDYGVDCVASGMGEALEMLKLSLKELYSDDQGA